MERKNIKHLGYGGEMYVVIVYDVSVERVSKVCHFLRQYLNWIQNSVFEGEIGISQLKEIKIGLKRIIKEDEDSITIYKMRSPDSFKKEQIGIEKADSSFVI